MELFSQTSLLSNRGVLGMLILKLHLLVCCEYGELLTDAELI